MRWINRWRVFIFIKESATVWCARSLLLMVCCFKTISIGVAFWGNVETYYSITIPEARTKERKKRERERVRRDCRVIYLTCSISIEFRVTLSLHNILIVCAIAVNFDRVQRRCRQIALHFNQRKSCHTANIIYEVDARFKSRKINFNWTDEINQNAHLTSIATHRLKAFTAWRKRRSDYDECRESDVLHKSGNRHDFVRFDLTETKLR